LNRQKQKLAIYINACANQQSKSSNISQWKSSSLFNRTSYKDYFN